MFYDFELEAIYINKYFKINVTGDLSNSNLKATTIRDIGDQITRQLEKSIIIFKQGINLHKYDLERKKYPAAVRLFVKQLTFFAFF